MRLRAKKLEKLTLFEIYVQFLRGTKKSGAFSAAESLFPIGPLLWKALWQGWAKLVLIALERYSVELKRLTFNFR